MDHRGTHETRRALEFRARARSDHVGIAATVFCDADNQTRAAARQPFDRDRLISHARHHSSVFDKARDRERRFHSNSVPHVRPVRPSAGFHIAFRAPSRAAVVAFYEAALHAGGRDYGAPGLRPRYHSHYFGAFVLDPDGHHIEAVCHQPDPNDASDRE